MKRMIFAFFTLFLLSTTETRGGEDWICDKSDNKSIIKVYDPVFGIYVVSIDMSESEQVIIRTFQTEMKRLAHSGYAFGFNRNAVAFVQLSDGSYWLSFAFGKLDKLPVTISPDTA